MGAPNCGRNGRGMIAVTNHPYKRMFHDCAPMDAVTGPSNLDDPAANSWGSSRNGSRAGTKISLCHQRKGTTGEVAGRHWVMTTLQQIELRCPICDTRFKSQQVISTNSFGGKRTDFHERAAGTQPLPFLIHMCNRCGYSGAERDFTEEADVSAGLREHVWNELAPQISTGAVLGSEKYEAAAKVAEWQALDARHVADLLLRAAWCCVDEADTEAERFFRRKAAWKFEEALSSFDGVAREERAVLTYLVGELWRRVGDGGQATAWFNRVPGEITDLATQQWVLDAARQQRDCPREWFG
jgi:uncharacterized protein